MTVAVALTLFVAPLSAPVARGTPPAPEPRPVVAADHTGRLADIPAASWTTVASWYGDKFAGLTTASGVPYDPDAMVAAHPDLPFGTVLRVHHAGRHVTVVVIDRGPFISGRGLDLSRAAFARIAPLGQGLARVHVEILR